MILSKAHPIESRAVNKTDTKFELELEWESLMVLSLLTWVIIVNQIKLFPAFSVFSVLV